MRNLAGRKPKECFSKMNDDKMIERYKQEIEKMEFQRAKNIYVLRAIREELARLEKWKAHREEH